MAEIRSIYTDKRKNSDRTRQTYVNGTAVRKLQVEEAPDRSRKKRRTPNARPRRARAEKPRYFSVGYTLFLAADCVLSLWLCAVFFMLMDDITALSKKFGALYLLLADQKAENDDEYNRVASSVDLEEVRDIAINELGMVYAGADQVVLYDGSGRDYVKQYAEIPQESSKKGLTGTRSR